MHLGLGESECIAQPLADVLEGGGLGRSPGIPIRPVPALDGVCQRLLVAPANPMHPQPRMRCDRDQRVVVVVLLEIHLDGDVVGNRPDDPVHARNRRRVTDQQIAGRLLLGNVEARRTHQRHHRDGRAGRDGAGPLRRRTGRLVQHHVDREAAGGDVGLGDRVGALELRVGAVRVGEPEPQPSSGLGLRVLEQGLRHHAYPHEMRCDRYGFDHRRGVIARPEAPQYRALEPPSHQRSSPVAANSATHSELDGCGKATRAARLGHRTAISVGRPPGRGVTVFISQHIQT